MAEQRIGQVTHYFGKIGVAALSLEGHLKVGDRVHIVGNKTDFEQTVASLQVEHASIEEANPGDDVAIKLDDKVRDGDEVYKVTDSGGPA